MEYTFASRRQLSFIIQAGGRNKLVAFGDRNMAGVSVFLTTDPQVAHAVRRHALTRRGIIEETTKEVELEETLAGEPQVTVPGRKAKAVVARGAEPVKATLAGKPQVTVQAKERLFDNYTVARETICKELGVKKTDVRNPEALATVAKEHGIIIKYKEM